MSLLKRLLTVAASLSLFWSVTVFSAERQGPVTPQQQLAQIDDQIQELEGIKRGYESRALRHEDQAQRLQYYDKTYLEARRHLELAQENRDKAALVQEEIDRLKGQRKKLLEKYHGEAGFEDL